MKTPKLRRRVDGRYVTRLNGGDIYLGKDQAQAEIRYHQIISEWIQTGGQSVSVEPRESWYIAEVIERYLFDRKAFYGEDLANWDRGKSAMRYLNRGFGHYKVDQFGMGELRRLREIMCEPVARPYKDKKRPPRVYSICRTQINAMMREVTRFWKWAAEHEMASTEHYSRCKVLTPLQRGHCPAPETDPVKPVPLGDIEKVKGFVNRSVAALIDLQLLTGARPGELLHLTAEDLDRSGEVWKVRLAKHKTAHIGKQRCLYFGAKAQAVLKPLLLRRAPGEYLFSPKDHLDRVREMSEGHRREGQPESVRKTDRTIGLCYNKDSYRKAIARACEAAGVPHWHPHQLRHTAATEFRKQYGVEAARAALGHSHLNATEIYAEVDSAIAEKIAQEMG